MPKALGMVGCHLLEDEMVHVLDHDKDARVIFLVSNGVSDTIEHKLRSLQPERDLHLVSEENVADLIIDQEGTVILWQKPIELHLLPQELRDDVVSSLRLIEPLCGAIMVFYGLCGNAFRNFETVVQCVHVPVCSLTDHRGEMVDDCIGTAMGGTEEYLHLLRSHPGSFYLTPMWASNWRRFFHDIRVIEDEKNLDGAKYVFQFMGYKDTFKLKTGLGDGESFDRNVLEFGSCFDLRVGEINCTTTVAERSYLRAKELMAGK
ncbi:MAG: hypothetical protein A4E32_01549 [Methanomassiliicoccales archaeon PtaU1.Bin124]|nr:MAG: hypothetical protein A4E32_01549 [Methanomassiliicoccales archaeon PtaU1.Bin124]